jgi:hypothetical protein
MRFDSQEHLNEWIVNKSYPKIHDNIFNSACSYLKSDIALDLCCSYGLLAARLSTKLNIKMYGIDASYKVIEAGIKSQIPADLSIINVSETTINDVFNLISANGIKAIIARRALPELFGNNLDLGKQFAIGIAKAGIVEVLIEGRAKNANAVNSLSSIDDEIKLMSCAYELRRNFNNIAYMTRKSNYESL